MHQTIGRVDGTAFAVIRQLMCTMMTWWCPEECLKHGAAAVGMAISEESRCVTSKDKVADALQKSYRLLRQKLDFPPKDIILDCPLQSLRLDEHPAASGVPARMPAWLHTIFLQHVIPKGLNVALVDAGSLPLYTRRRGSAAKTLAGDPEQRQGFCRPRALHGSDAGLVEVTGSYVSWFSVTSGRRRLRPLYVSSEEIRARGTVSASVFHAFWSTVRFAANFHRPGWRLVEPQDLSGQLSPSVLEMAAKGTSETQ
ncbi:metH [Symbiodinium sp. CCMP2592]|nr:metH [Symbiodinium sp. CCMP2592]